MQCSLADYLRHQYDLTVNSYTQNIGWSDLVLANVDVKWSRMCANSIADVGLAPAWSD